MAIPLVTSNIASRVDEVTRQAKMTLIKTMTARQNNPDEEVEGIQADNKLRQQALDEPKES